MNLNKLQKLFFSFLFVFLVFGFLFFTSSIQPALAQPAMNQEMEEFQNITGLQPTPLPIVIGRIVRIVLGFLGLIAVIIIIIGGFIWMTSGGNPEKIDKAKKLMLAGLIGLLIIVFAYAIVSFILKFLGGVGGGGGGGGQACTPGQCLGCHFICKSDGTGGEWTSGCENLCGGLPQCPCPSEGTLPYITGSLPACQLSPSSGPIGTYVTIRGCRFGSYNPEASKVYFGDKEAEIVLCQGQPSWSETKIVVKVPEIKEGEYNVKVQNSVGESNTKAFRVTSGNPGPSIACLVPDYGKEKALIEIFGENFGRDERGGFVTFNNVTSTIDSWSDTLIKAYVPENAFSGDVIVTRNNQSSNGYPFWVICSGANDCASRCCQQGLCQPADHCRCAQAEESCENTLCCPGLSCCSDKKCRADCSIDGQCQYPNGQCPNGYTCCPDNLCKLNCGGNNPGQSCKQDNACGPDSLCTPYQCVSSGGNPPSECRCCCRDNNGCPNGLTCDTSQICYQGSTSTPAVYGLCCGCTDNSQCGIDNLCRTSLISNCCVSCQGQDNGTKCYVPGLPNNEGECCNNQCCHGYCINGQCLTTCGNHQLEDNEQCDSTASPMFHSDRDTCQEVDPKYVGGTLGCQPNCTFDLSGCLEAGQAGGIGELCKLGTTCLTGAPSCQNSETYSCLAEGNDCRCCCDPLNNKCPNNLICTADKAPCSGKSRGLCCGCKDDSQCEEHNVCGQDSCCYYLPPPNDIFFEANPSQIKIKWTYPTEYNKYNPYQYVTAFEIWRAESDTCPTNDDKYLKIAESKDCQADTNVVDCSYIDKGNFAGKTLCYRVRARHGNQTAYSEWKSNKVTIQPGQVGCQKNDDCPSSAPCCRLDTHQCVTWEFCQGHCTPGGACQPPAKKYAEADFMVTTGPIGACLISVVNNKEGSPYFRQPKGYWLDEIKATGKRFGLQGKEDKLVFEENKNASTTSWNDNEILAAVPAGAKFDNNLVVVKKSGLPDSNAVSFTVLKQETGPGQTCYKDISACSQNIGVCWNPPNNQVFSCLSGGEDCYCCCTPGQTPDLCKNINERLECRANQSPCTGNNRGLCCGCQNDADCGGTMGCGMIEPSPKCCYLRPSLERVSFCDNMGSPEVRLNTNITLTFNQKMDFGSLNGDNIKISRDGSCSSIDEGKTINGRCYLYGTIVSYLAFEGNTTTTKTVFSPKLCRLKQYTQYQIEIVVGENGQGVRSEKGVSMGLDGAGFCSWDSNKSCLSKSFTTVNSETLCEISWIDVQPREQIVRDLNVAVNYYAYARDSSNQSVCVSGFNWSSSNNGVAVVSPDPNDSKIGIATSKGLGEAIIIASASGKVCTQIPEQNRTCGKIKVSLGGPRVIEHQGCSVCQESGQSPSPWKFSTDACLQTQIVAKFDREIESSTLNSNNIKVCQCANNDFNNCGDCSDISGNIATGGNLFHFQPNNPLIANKIYRVTLKSGPLGIKDTNGLQLDGNRNGLEDGSPADDYVWYFKTTNTNCSLNKVCVYPNQATLILPDNSTQNFQAEIYTSNCNYLNASSSEWSWNWESLNPKIATVSPTNQWQTTATGKSLGETEIKVTEQNNQKSDQAHLIVATHPSVIKHQPTGENVCRNALISATFDQEMNRATLNSSTVKLYKEGFGGGPEQPITQRIFEFFKNIIFKVAKALIQVPNLEEIIPGETEIKGIINPPTSWTQVPATVSSYNTIVNGQTKTVVVLTPTSVLESLKQYQVKISGSVQSKYGVEMGSDEVWQFKTGQEICKIERVKIQPDSYTFTKRNETINFTATAYTKNNQAINPVPGSYTWDWFWSSSDESIVTVTNSGNNNPNTQTATADNKNGSAIITATATDSENKKYSAQAQVQVFLCENPWSYENNEHNFKLLYCRDAGQPGTADDLPLLTGPKEGPTSGNLLLNLLFNVQGKPDVIGLQVYKNPDHLTPENWYLQNVPNPGSVSNLFIDGYQAVQSGRTIYVGATNVNLDDPTKPKIDTNVYLISYNDNASPETINIFNQLVKNWRFNTNLANATDKGKIQRDLTRIYHLNQMAPLFENYKNQKGHYPKLESGTYIIGMTTSRWSSWQQTLGQELGQPLPIDPINKFENRSDCHDEGVPVDGHSCCADCPSKDPQCNNTCYNPAPNKKKYECVNGSNVYQYQVLENGNKYSIYMKFEYGSPDFWQHNCGSYTNKATCSVHHWCEWKPGCHSKNLNYSSNPCTSPSSCQCFNTVYQPAQETGQGGSL